MRFLDYGTVNSDMCLDSNPNFSSTTSCSSGQASLGTSDSRRPASLKINPSHQGHQKTPGKGRQPIPSLSVNCMHHDPSCGGCYELLVRADLGLLLLETNSKQRPLRKLPDRLAVGLSQTDLSDGAPQDCGGVLVHSLMPATLPMGRYFLDTITGFCRVYVRLMWVLYVSLALNHAGMPTL